MSDPSRRAVILGGARTPFGKLSGALATQSAVDLGTVGRAGRDRARRHLPQRRREHHHRPGAPGRRRTDPVPSGRASAPASASTVTAETINRVCGSGMRAITLADSLIRAGDYDVVVAGGMESMTNAPYLLRKARTGYRMGDGVLEDMMIGDGLQCAVAMRPHGHPRRQRRRRGRGRPRGAGRLGAALPPARDRRAGRRAASPTRSCRSRSRDKGARRSSTQDEAPRRDTSAEALAKLKPAFEPEGTVTAGNAPGVNDGAAALVVASARLGRDAGLTPLRDDPRPRRGRLGRRRTWPTRRRWPRRRRSPGPGLKPSDIDVWSRSTRRSPASPIISAQAPRHRPGPASTSMAARSRSATRSAPAARGSS